MRLIRRFAWRHLKRLLIVTERQRYSTLTKGAQFTSEDFTGLLIENGIKISIDGKGRWMDNVFIERLWRNVKYEEVYIKAYGSISEAKSELKKYFELYNQRRRHQGLDYQTPDEVYFATSKKLPTAV